MLKNVELFWTKMDKLRDKYRPNQGKEWSIDACNLTKEQKLQLKDAGVLGRVKNKMDDRGDFIHFTVSEYQRPRKDKPNGKYDLWDFDEGSLDEAFDAGYIAKKNERPPVFKEDGKTDWDFKTDGLIGNATKADVKFNVQGTNVYLVAVRVTELVEFEQKGDYEDVNDWGDTDEAPVAKPVKKAKTAAPELDADDEDQIPF